MTPAQTCALLAGVATALAASELRAALARSGAGSGAGSGAAGAAPRLAPLLRRRLPAGGDALLGAALAGCAALLIATPPVAALAALAAGAGWRLRERRAAGRATRARERAMPAFARSVADALRGGHSVRSAVAASADDRSLPAALRDELTQLARAVDRGAGLRERLGELAARGGAGLRVASGTIALHLDAGGALAGELERLAREGEAALRIEQQREAATAQARATVRVVAGLPVLALAGAELTSSGFLASVAREPVALALLLAGVVLEVAAVLAVRAIAGGGGR